MNKVIILSVQPQYLHKILTGKKTIEIRKSMPKDCEYPIDVYLYCTKGKPYLYESFKELWWWNDGVLEPFCDRYGVRLSDFELPEKFHDSESRGWNNLLNGFIVAKFTLNKAWNFKVDKNDKLEEIGFNPYGVEICGIEDITKSLIERSCLTLKEMYEYAPYRNLYAWHIENLAIFDKTMELKEFYRNCDDFVDARPCNCGKHCEYEGYDLQEHCRICTIDYDGSNCPFLRISRPPMSWEYAYVEKD